MTRSAQPTDDPHPHRVLVMAEEANPEQVSVPLEGYSHAQAILKRSRESGGWAHLVTQVRNREALLRAGWAEGPDADFTVIDTEPIAAPMNTLGEWVRGGGGKGWTTVMAMRAFTTYAAFDMAAWSRFKGEARAGEIDIVHRLTPLSPTVPWRRIAAWERAGVRTVMGPINGGVPWPRAFDSARRAEREWLSYIRDAHKLVPGYAKTRRRASAITIGSTATFGQMPERYRERCVYIPENAIDPSRFAAERTVPAGAHDGPVRLVFVGRLVPYKGADMLLEAAAPLVRDGRATVTILGDGDEMPKLKAIVEREQLTDGVHLPGWVKHEELSEKLAQADVFAFPSIREFGGAVVLEAMALGVVPVVADYGGPSELVTDATGVRVPMADRAGLVASFRSALEGVVADRPALARMGTAARERVFAHFTWDAKATMDAAVYDWVRGGAEKPDFGMPIG